MQDKSPRSLHMLVSDGFSNFCNFHYVVHGSNEVLGTSSLRFCKRCGILLDKARYSSTQSTWRGTSIEPNRVGNCWVIWRECRPKCSTSRRPGSWLGVALPLLLPPHPPWAPWFLKNYRQGRRATRKREAGSPRCSPLKYPRFDETQKFPVGVVRVGLWWNQGSFDNHLIPFNNHMHNYDVSMKRTKMARTFNWCWVIYYIFFMVWYSIFYSVNSTLIQTTFPPLRSLN